MGFRNAKGIYAGISENKPQQADDLASELLNIQQQNEVVEESSIDIPMFIQHEEKTESTIKEKIKKEVKKTNSVKKNKKNSKK
jgi:hypothetical protein